MGVYRVVPLSEFLCPLNKVLLLSAGYGFYLFFYSNTFPSLFNQEVPHLVLLPLCPLLQLRFPKSHQE